MTRRFDDLRFTRAQRPGPVEWLLAGLGVFLGAMAIGAALLIMLGWPRPAHAGRAGSWYPAQKLTSETQKRLGVTFASCCDAGDVYHTRFRVVEDGSKYGRDEWQYEQDGKWLWVPPDIIERVETPSGEPVLFLFPYDDNPLIKKGTPVCFKLPPSKG